MRPLSQQRVVITGAGQGLGAAIARVFAREGADLVLMDVDAGALAAVNAAIGGRAQCMIVDLADAEATATAIAAPSTRSSTMPRSCAPNRSTRSASPHFAPR